MGLFVFVGEDALKVVSGQESDTTKKLIKSAGKDLEKGLDEIMP